jgi:hypothetical protein
VLVDFDLQMLFGIDSRIRRIQNFAVLAGAGAHDVFPAPDGQSGSPRNPRANLAGSIPGPGNRI